jgi:hypothetical protein
VVAGSDGCVGSGNATPWDIGLDPIVPLALTVFASSGSSTVNLGGLRALRSLEVHANSGDSEVTLPAADPLSAYRLELGLLAARKNGRKGS